MASLCMPGLHGGASSSTSSSGSSGWAGAIAGVPLMQQPQQPQQQPAIRGVSNRIERSIVSRAIALLISQGNMPRSKCVT